MASTDCEYPVTEKRNSQETIDTKGVANCYGINKQQARAKTSGSIAVREKFRPCVSCKNPTIRKLLKTTFLLFRGVRGLFRRCNGKGNH